MIGFDDFQRLVHHSRGINGDFCSHAPVGMLQGLFPGHMQQVGATASPEGTARSRQDEFLSILPAPGKALEQGVVFRVHRQNDGAARRTDASQQIARQHQRFLVGQSDNLSRQSRRQRPGQSGSADLRGKHHAGFRQGSHAGITVRAD